eukprot:10962551-Alexandrium_andersonii.AAC.1
MGGIRFRIRRRFLGSSLALEERPDPFGPLPQTSKRLSLRASLVRAPRQMQDWHRSSRNGASFPAS